MERQRAIPRVPGRRGGAAASRRHLHPVRLHVVRGARELAPPVGRGARRRRPGGADPAEEESGDPLGGLYAE